MNSEIVIIFYNNYINSYLVKWQRSQILQTHRLCEPQHLHKRGNQGEVKQILDQVQNEELIALQNPLLLFEAKRLYYGHSSILHLSHVLNRKECEQQIMEMELRRKKSTISVQSAVVKAVTIHT